MAKRATPASSPLPNLTRPELDVLKLLWAESRLSAREVHERLSERYDWAYSTTRTTMERMVKKSLLARREFHGLHLYEAAVSRPVGLASMVRDFAERVLEADPASVVNLMARSKTLSTDELDELRRLIDTPPRGQRKR